MPPERPERIYLEEDRPLHQRDPESLSDAEAITRLVQVEADIAGSHALRAQLIALVAAQRPAAADRPADQPGAAGPLTTPHRHADPTGEDSAACTDGGDDADVVPEILEVSEWLPHELQMAHPYSWTAVQDLVQTSLVLTGRLSATLALLRAGRIDYIRARILADLLGTCSEPVAHTVEALVLPTAPGLTPGGLAGAVRRALARVDAQALRRRHARARRVADVGYYPTQDGMARFYADLPLPVATACTDAVAGYAKTQQADGDDRPIGQIRTEVLTDLILRPWDTSRHPVTAEVTIHLTIPSTGENLDDDAAAADLDGQIITAAQCAELLTQLGSSRLFLALHDKDGDLQAVASPAQLRRAARRRGRRGRTRTDRAGVEGPDNVDGPGLRPPAMTTGYRPTREQVRHVRTRDRTCRHFGCTRRARHADLDHHRPHPEGATSICNLCCYCRTHHRLKHQAPGWTRDFGPDGTLTITTPTGTTRSTRPPGPETLWPAPAGAQPGPPRLTVADEYDSPPF